MGLRTAGLRQLLQAKAAHVGLPTWNARRYSMSFDPAVWLEGLILTESGGNPRARRYEPAQDRASRVDAPADPDTCEFDDGEIEDDASYGLCQVMGSNIRALSGAVPLVMFTRYNPRPVRAMSIDSEGAFWAPMSFTFAFLEDTNITFAMRLLLAELKAVGGDVERALARYNGGPTGDDVAPKYGNDMRLRKYVDKVAAHSQEVMRDLALLLKGL